MADRKKTIFRSQTVVNGALPASGTVLLDRNSSDSKAMLKDFNDAELLNNSGEDIKAHIRLDSRPDYNKVIPAGASWVLEPEDGEYFDGTIQIENMSAVNAIGAGEIELQKAIKEFA